MRFCFFSYPVMREDRKRSMTEKKRNTHSGARASHTEQRYRIWLRRIRRLRADVVFVTAGILLLAAAAIVTTLEQKEAVKTEETIADTSDMVIVIDAGHGGRDSGKVSVDQVTYEKDINLAIAYKLKSYLEAEGITVIMTRETDDGLYVESDSNKKAADLRRRIEVIERASPVLVVSIHQNSYHEAYVRGAQTFYYTTSEEGKQLAEIIQEQLCLSLDPENGRKAKANDSYYLLKKTSVPIVIVECGFLSNPEEAALLTTADYQDRVAFQIHLGVMQYLNQSKKRLS